MNIDKPEDYITWAEVLERNWKAFNAVCDDMRQRQAMDPMKFRGYVLWDMQQRHNHEVTK